MVYIKAIELTNFKSFGGTTRVPFEPVFTVISGPNGSGKSNILDALLFCLGLSSSKGMRADRLPDLVNHNQNSRKSTVEASVTVTFDLSDDVGTNGISPLQDTEEEGESAEQEPFSEPFTGEMEETPEEGGQKEGELGNWGIGELGGGEESNLAPQTSYLAPHTSTDWSVTRRLRVTKSGSYTSTYYINGEPCTLNELHEQMNRLKIYPEGYNVVLQGDVTDIISMNAKERREIIDELAGVAQFDRKINQARDKLNAVKEREDQCRIVEKELTAQRDRLAADKIKAEKYKQLRGQLEEREAWEIVLKWRQLKHQEQKLRSQIETGDRSKNDLRDRLANFVAEIEAATKKVEELAAIVKSLGEEELIAVQSQFAQQEAQHEQLQQRHTELETEIHNTTNAIARQEESLVDRQRELESIINQKQELETETIASLRNEVETASNILEQSREAASNIADIAESWVREQTNLRHQTETLLHEIEPQRSQQAQLRERVAQFDSKIAELRQSQVNLGRELEEKSQQQQQLATTETELRDRVSDLTQTVSEIQQELTLQRGTQTRLLQEQRDKERRLDKLEAETRVRQEATGSYATKLILGANLDGVCGLVAQLGRVDPEYQLALETAAGGRLANIVVEDDLVASVGIRLLKEKRAGRATFLPLNKVRSPQFSRRGNIERSPGFIEYAVELVERDPRYDRVFAYVFGTTAVFDTLDNARIVLGQTRIVTLEGELLETSGAMTGGSSGRSSPIHFGSVEASESTEVITLRERLKEIDTVLNRCLSAIEGLSQEEKTRSQELIELRQQHREVQLKAEQLQKEINSLQQQQETTRSQLENQVSDFSTQSDRLQQLDTELPEKEAQLDRLRQQLTEMEASQTHSEWQQAQALIRQQEAVLNEKEAALKAAKDNLQTLETQQQRLEASIEESQHRLHDDRTARETQYTQRSALENQQVNVRRQMAQTQEKLGQLEAKLGEEKQQRDRAEAHLRERHLAKQQLEWRLEKLQESQQQRKEQLQHLEEELRSRSEELPDPIPDVPEDAQLDAIAAEVKHLQKRIRDMEPVNMLALEEYDKVRSRLEDLTAKLTTLEGERTEILLRIENFTTLRLQSFREAFDVVNENFSHIFAELSQGDGHLELSHPDNPFEGGLNLVAHPKGKPVQRLASMSGGEKSLTALSFIFALQRYRPSPFYAFDEVDMFLDGANVERLAKMIKKQAQHAQFIVVSLRRPTIESAERTIGVTQARGAYTQVLGLKLNQPTVTSS